MYWLYWIFLCGVYPKIDALNYTFIVLISKLKNTQCMEDFWVISLCNLIKKLISKVLNNWLKLILPSLIDPTQLIFVLGCLKAYNAIISIENFHLLNCSPSPNTSDMVLKLDMHKEYDRIKWDYLFLIIQYRAFPSSFIDCVVCPICLLDFNW